jgi:hypothetical protein
MKYLPGGEQYYLTCMFTLHNMLLSKGFSMNFCQQQQAKTALQSEFCCAEKGQEVLCLWVSSSPHSTFPINMTRLHQNEKPVDVGRDQAD